MPREKPAVRGRPKTPLIERLRVIVWSHHVLAASGAASIQDFESMYAKSGRKVVLSSGLWARYMRGEVIPQGAKDDRARSLIARMNKEFPGTARVYRHPVWEVLDLGRLLGPEELKHAYLELDLSVSEPFIARGYDLLGLAPPAASIFWRAHENEGRRMHFLKRLQGLDGLTASLIEARMDYLAQNERTLFNSLSVAHATCKNLTNSPAFDFKRMMSAALLIECICISFLDQLLIQGPSSDEARSQRRRNAKGLREDWLERWTEHRSTLSINSRKKFEAWGLEAWNMPRFNPAARIDEQRLRGN